MQTWSGRRRVNVNDVFPRVLGPYVLLRRIGRGGMGDVYVAKHGSLLGFEKHCVLKMMRDDRANDDAMLARFADEARVVVQLSHRNICPVFDVGRVGARLYVALEHIVGRDLRTVATAAPMPMSLALHIVGEVLEALEYAHRFVDVKTGASLGIVHRDVSPQNVLLGAQGDTKLIDFGIATTHAQQPDYREQVLGKLGYMSPEHARGEVVDARSDQFASAIVLSELVLGNRFYAGLIREQTIEVVGLGSHRPPSWSTLPEGLRTILDRALAINVEQRFASCADFGDALNVWARAHGQVANPRDVQRHLAQVFGDLAAEHRALLVAIDVTLDPRMATGEKIAFGPGGSAPADDEFESLATTLASPGLAPMFGNADTTYVLARPVVAPPADFQKRHRSALLILTAGLVLGVSALIFINTWRAEVVPPPTADAVLVGFSMPERKATRAALWVPPPPALPAAHDDDDDDDGPDHDQGDDQHDGDGAVGAGVVPGVGEGVDAASEVVDRTPRPATSGPPPLMQRARVAAIQLDAATRTDIAALLNCVARVSCAKGLIEWSRQPGLTITDRIQLKDSAHSCVQKCRLK